MSRVTPFQLGFEVDDSLLAPGTIFRKLDGTLWKVNPNGSQSPLSSGGAGAWGEAATAQFTGSGSPVGVVTPNGEGDLYVDSDTPALWQATGATNTDWALSGGGSLPQVGVQTTLNTAANYEDLLAAGYVPVAEGKLIALAITTLPMVAVGAASSVAQINGGAANPYITDMPTDGQMYANMTITLEVVNEDSTEWIKVTKNANGDPGVAIQTLDLSDATVTQVAGTDLSATLDANFAHVVSAAGGTFVGVLSLQATVHDDS